jgi:hypothetical protein
MIKSGSAGTVIPKQKRFSTQKQEKPTPGPGEYYDDDIEEGWNKKSYNIIFSDLS